MSLDTCTSGLSKSKVATRKENLVQAYGNWLNSISWSYYCTFTTRYQMTTKAARRSMQRMFELISKQYNCNPNIFWVAEPFDSKYGCHIHALIKVECLTTVTRKDLQNAWQVVSKGKGLKEYNNTTIKVYDPAKGGHFYFSKYLQSTGIDYDILL